MVKTYSILDKFVVGKSKKGGRNSYGRVTLKGRSGGHKRCYRLIDFKRSFEGIYGRVKGEIYDSNRKTNLMQILYSNGIITSVLKPVGLKIGDLVCNDGLGVVSDFKLGDNVMCGNMKKGVFFHNLELDKGKGGKCLRAGGSYGQVVRLIGSRLLLKMCSGKLAISGVGCKVSIGKVFFRRGVKIRKAGRNRWLGYKSKVRGVAMNPVDHPHGGATSGGRCSVSSSGKYTKCGGNKKLKRVRVENILKKL